MTLSPTPRETSTFLPCGASSVPFALCIISCTPPPGALPTPRSLTIAKVGAVKPPFESVETDALAIVPVESVGIGLIKSLSVIALEMLLIPPIILLSPPIALFATDLPKSAAASAISPPISLIQSSVLLNQVLKPLYTDFAFDHAVLEILSNLSKADSYMSPTQLFKLLYASPNHFEVPRHTLFAFDHATLDIASHFFNALFFMSLSQPFILLNALFIHFEVPL